MARPDRGLTGLVKTNNAHERLSSVTYACGKQIIALFPRKYKGLKANSYTKFETKTTACQFLRLWPHAADKISRSQARFSRRGNQVGKRTGRICGVALPFVVHRRVERGQ